MGVTKDEIHLVASSQSASMIVLLSHAMITDCILPEGMPRSVNILFSNTLMG